MKRTTLILSRDLMHPAPRMPEPEMFRLETIATPRDEYFAPLDQFCSAHIYPPGWVLKMLENQARAWLVIGPAGAAAAAWTTSRTMFIDEIGYDFTPPENGDYFFGDFVAPQQRGRNLQRLLLNRRLQASSAAGRRWATAMSDAANTASLRSHLREGFVKAAALTSLRLRAWRFDYLRRISRSAPPGTLSGNKWRAKLSMSFGRH